MELNDSLIWVEKFRPTKVEDCILPERIKGFFREMLATGQIQNYTAVGNAGSGKTSSARAICDELGIEYLLINASVDNGIDTIRTKIISYASTMSFTNDYRVIIFDEADHLNPNSSQPALRGIISDFQENCRFIFTANYANKIIEPIYSRCPIVDFTFTNDEKKEMLIQFIKRTEYILTSQDIAYNRKELAQFCSKNFPDFRKTLNLLQRNSVNKELTFTSLGVNSDEKVVELIAHLKDKSFTKMREWVTNNVQSNDGHLIRRAIYDRMMDKVVMDSIPTLILLINSYDAKEAIVVDKEINMVAFFVEVMMGVEFK